MRLLALLALTLVGCLKEKVPFCENGAFCPEPLVCTERGTAPFCGTAAEVLPCMGLDDEAACTLAGDAKGFCEAGLCKACDENNAACTYETWVQMPAGVSADLFAIHVAGPRDVYAAGRGGVVVHWDGRAWTVLPAPESGDLRAIAGAGDTLFAAATTKMYRFASTAWTAEAASPNAILGMWGTGEAFYAAGFRATVGRTTASGWTYVEDPLSLPGPPGLNAIWGRAADDVFAVGTAGTVMHWNGAAWSTQATPGNYILLGVGGDHAVGRVTGGAGMPAMLRFAGTWQDISNRLPAEIANQPIALRGVWANATDVFAVGDAGKIVHVANDTYTLMPSGTNNALNAVAGSGADVFAVGAGGVVLRYRIP